MNESKMQNVTFCEGLSIYSGYSHQPVNGLGYHAHELNCFSALHVMTTDWLVLAVLHWLFHASQS